MKSVNNLTAVNPEDISLDTIEKEYSSFVGRKVLFLIALVVLILALIGVATTLGVIDLSIWEVYSYYLV